MERIKLHSPKIFEWLGEGNINHISPQYNIEILILTDKQKKGIKGADN